MSADGLRVLAVDDERPQLEDLARLLHGFTAVDSVECADDAREALHRLAGEPYDAVFLDVRMPGLDGLELARVLRRFAAPPQLVFVSAFDGAAVDAFELRALDFLLKPVSRRRLEEAVGRVVSALDRDEEAPAPSAEAHGAGGMIAVADVRSGTTRLINRSAILYVQSYGDFVRVVTADGRYLLRGRLSDVEQRWEPFGFFRVHRQYLANLGLARELRPQLRGGTELAFAEDLSIPVARRQAAELSRRLRV
jgi:DNA-binding LytR/AlgR family response regulator